MHNLNEHVRNLHQAAYDYVWDRWGIYLGTFRTWLIILAYSHCLLPPVYRLLTGGDATLAGTIANSVAIFALIWFFALRNHLGDEWEAQRDGRYDFINARSLRSRNAGPMARGCTSAFLIAGLFIFGADAIEVAATILTVGFANAWFYAMEVMVRDREPSRFAQGRTVAQGTA